MLATQYSVFLPADYDMGIIRTRVAERGHLLDERAGLGLKAYLVTDAGRGAIRNQYSPFYLWNDPSAAGRFLWGGGGFSGIVRDFGRPAVETWIGAGFLLGPARDVAPGFARIVRRALTRGVDPQGEVTELVNELGHVASSVGLHSVAAVVNPISWEVAAFELWRDAPSPGTGEVFEVLHLSAPGISELGAAASA